jgi:hypothetical protein
MNGRRRSRLAAALALAAALQVTTAPLAAAGPRRPAGTLRHESFIESVWSRVAGLWEGITARWAADGAGADPLGKPSSQGDGGGGADPFG